MKLKKLLSRIQVHLRLLKPEQGIKEPRYNKMINMFKQRISISIESQFKHIIFRFLFSFMGSLLVIMFSIVSVTGIEFEDILLLIEEGRSELCMEIALNNFKLSFE